MSIEVRCPNGHRLSCPDDRAGKAAKCPKCGEIFTIPVPEAPVVASAGSGTSMPAVADSGSLSSIGKGQRVEAASDSAATSSDLIVFLCPNGHKLNAPPTMQGKPGKCPHCGAKFLIPQYTMEDAGGDEPLDGESEPEVDLDVSEEPPADAPAPPSLGPPELPFDFSAGLGGPVEPTDALPRIFNEFWTHHDQTLVIEVTLRSGATITPHHYSPSPAGEGYAIFAVKEPHGAFTVSVVRWDQVERITVRGMADLPPEYFG